MSLLNPGGSRSLRFGRVFGHENIKRLVQTHKRDHAKGAHTSIALGNRNIRRIGPPYDFFPHEHKREIARRLRQQKRKQS